MSIGKKNIRSLQDIRTLSGSVDQVFQPYKAYMRVTTLEMEKLRRSQERESAINRVNNIDARFKEIEAEKSALLESLRVHKGASDETPAMKHKTAPRRSPGGFKIRY